jgi:1-deoxy-D-xylulose-5-phosphate reductoisomerase
MRRKITVLGSTGSIGTQALEIISENPERFELVGLSAGSNAEALAAQRKQFGLDSTHVALGSQASVELVQNVKADVVVNGITGSVGLGPTLAALESGATLALANKESLIVGGALVTEKAKPGQIVPVDSEHSALAQCLLAGAPKEVERLILTASGGPFHGMNREQLRNVTPEQALAHPTWVMGRVVTTNSATLVNKGLEVIEAHLLFGVPFERIAVTVHRQSVVHSMVEFSDGSVIAQASPPSMRIPIALGMAWPERVPGAGQPIDWLRSHTWTFEPLDEELFASVRLARQVGLAGSTYPAVYNAANEQAVEAFHRGRLAFTEIVELIEAVLELHTAAPELSLAAVLEAEIWARETADSLIAKWAGR